jgi:hypothetical protein
MDAVYPNLARRWYIGYDLGERVPDHSSLGKIREGYGLEVLLLFFLSDFDPRAFRAAPFRNFRNAPS